MNYANYQKKILTDLSKGKRWFIDEIGNNYIVTEGYHMRLIPKDEFYLNIDKFKKDERFSKTRKDLVNEYENLNQMEITKEVVEKVGRNKLRIVETENMKKGFNMKFLSDFDKDYELWTSDEVISPGFAVENNDVVGVILPIRMNR